MTDRNIQQLKALLKIAQDKKQPPLRRWWASRLAGGIIDNCENWPDQQIRIIQEFRKYERNK